MKEAGRISSSASYSLINLLMLFSCQLESCKASQQVVSSELSLSPWNVNPSVCFIQLPGRS